VLFDAIGSEASDPLTDRTPDHAPDAVQLSALVVVQANEVVCPATTDVGVAVSVSVGAGTVTITVALCVAVPPSPVHASVNEVVACSAAVASVPDVALLPDQPPLAEQVDASVLLHESDVAAPAVMLAASADSVTVGVGTGAGSLSGPQAPSQTPSSAGLTVRRKRAGLFAISGIIPHPFRGTALMRLMNFLALTLLTSTLASCDSRQSEAQRSADMAAKQAADAASAQLRAEAESRADASATAVTDAAAAAEAARAERGSAGH
jgi:hypothetical protein